MSPAPFTTAQEWRAADRVFAQWTVTLQPFGTSTKAIAADKETVETFGRMQEHLKANAVPVETTPLRVGRKLAVNTQTERFVNDPEADALLTREYRRPFVVPERV